MFLNSLIDVVHESRKIMHRLFVPLGWGLSPGESAHVPVFACESARRWIAVLGSCAGVHWATAHVLDRRDVTSPADIVSYVDDALEGAAVPSLDGYSHGSYWSAAIADLDLGFMSVIPLEFAAYGIEVTIASNGAGDGARFAIYADSLSSAGVLCGKSPSALLVRVVHSEIAALPEFRALAPTLVAGHCFGEGSPCADLASRGRFVGL